MGADEPEAPEAVSWHVTITAGNGSTHEADLDDDWMPAGDHPPTPLEVLARFSAEMSELHGEFFRIGYRAPLTITIEETSHGVEP